MSSTVKKTNDAKLDIEVLDSVIELKARACSLEGTKGFFLPEAQISELRNGISSVVGQHNLSDTDSRVVEARAAADKLQADLNAALSSIANHKSMIEVAKVKVEEAEAARDKSANAADVREGALRAEKHKLTLELAEAKAKRKSIRKENGFALLDEDKLAIENELTLSIKTLQDQLAQVNSESAKLKNEVKVANDAQAMAESELNSLRERYNNLSGKMAAGRTITTPFTEKPVHIELDDQVARFLGKAGADAFRALFFVPPNDVRDKAFNLMLVAKKSSNEKVNKLYTLLEELFKWVKANAAKARVVLAPWLDMVEADIAARSIRTMAFYRAELAKLVQLHKNAADNVNRNRGTKVGQKLTWYENAIIWVELVTYRRPKRYASKAYKSTKAGFSAAFTYCKSVVKSTPPAFRRFLDNVKNLFRTKPFRYRQVNPDDVEEITIFNTDADFQPDGQGGWIEVPVGGTSKT